MMLQNWQSILHPPSYTRSSMSKHITNHNPAIHEQIFSFRMTVPSNQICLTLRGDEPTMNACLPQLPQLQRANPPSRCVRGNCIAMGPFLVEWPEGMGSRLVGETEGPHSSPPLHLLASHAHRIPVIRPPLSFHPLSSLPSPSPPLTNPPPFVSTLPRALMRRVFRSRFKFCRQL
jgi:hypothetical protein